MIPFSEGVRKVRVIVLHSWSLVVDHFVTPTASERLIFAPRLNFVLISDRIVPPPLRDVSSLGEQREKECSASASG